MPRLAIALLLLCTVASAHAQDATTKAEAEAISFLKPCHQKTADDVASCQQNQWFFVEAYVSAKGGSVTHMLLVASYFGPRHSPGERDAALGIPENDVEACAWRITNWAWTSPDDFVRNGIDFAAQTVCPGLAIHGYAAAFVRAGRLANDLNTDPVATVPDGWQPSIPWIKHNPLPNLDSTVAPLRP